jgi:hypothetical protein
LESIAKPSVARHRAMWMSTGAHPVLSRMAVFSVFLATTQVPCHTWPHFCDEAERGEMPDLNHSTVCAPTPNQLSTSECSSSSASFPPTMAGVDTADSRPAFVSPRSLLEQSRPTLPRATTAIDHEQIDGLRTIRAFLKARTSYDVLPISYRLIVLDTALLVKKSLNILNQNGRLTPRQSRDGR